MAQTTIKAGQTWWDIAIELAGAWEAGIDLALLRGLSMSERPPLGERVQVSRSYNRPMERYCHAEGVSPATAEDHQGLRWQIFSPTFNSTFR